MAGGSRTNSTELMNVGAWNKKRPPLCVGKREGRTSNHNIFNTEAESEVCQVKIKFEFEKETKNSVRFKEISKTPVIRALYVKKSALPALDYKEGGGLTVTISKEEK